ncbi:hypothetical protein Tco_0554572, partial [Tanacetum coccineum]
YAPFPLHPHLYVRVRHEFVFCNEAGNSGDVCQSPSESIGMLPSFLRQHRSFGPGNLRSVLQVLWENRLADTLEWKEMISRCPTIALIVHGAFSCFFSFESVTFVELPMQIFAPVKVMDRASSLTLAFYMVYIDCPCCVFYLTNEGGRGVAVVLLCWRNFSRVLMMALDLTCPSTSQLLWSISLVLARASLAAISKLLSLSGCSKGDYTSSMIPQVYSPKSFSPMYPPTHPSQPQINHLSVPPSHLYQSQASSVP